MEKINRKKNIKLLIIFILLIIILIAIAFIINNREIIARISQVEKAYDGDVTVETTYKINSIDGNNIQVTIKIKNNLGIQEVTTPDGRNIVANGKKRVGIDYNVVDGQSYTFKVKFTGQDEFKDFILNATTEQIPTITYTAATAYPMLTTDGVKTTQIVKIDFGTNTNNYYSIGSDDNYVEYTGSDIQVNENCRIYAKTIVEGEITQESDKNVVVQLAGDALPKTAYNGNTNINSSYSAKSAGGIAAQKWMLVDSEMVGKKFKIFAKYDPADAPSSTHSSIGIKFYNEDTYLSVVNLKYSANNNKYVDVTVPDGTTKILFIIYADGGWSGGSGIGYICDIKV